MDGGYQGIIGICISVDAALCPAVDIFSSYLKEMLTIKGSLIPGISEIEFPGEKMD